MEPRTRSRRFTVIGAGGPAGLATVKVISEELGDRLTTGECELVGFEQRDDVGGAWLADSSPFLPPELPRSPMYDNMVTNIPHPIMYYPSYPTPTPSPLFSNAGTVENYLKLYARNFNLKSRILFNSRVTAATWDHSTSQWKIEYHKDGLTKISYFNHLFVSNGRRPYVPRIPGFDAWLSSESRAFTHSMGYRNPDSYRGHCVLIIGNGPSAADIFEEIAPVASRIIHSIRSLTTQEGPASATELRGPILRFSSDGFVYFQDGTTEYVDRVIFATGYRHDCSFLTQVPRHGPEIVSDHFSDSGFHLYPLALHMFPLRAPFPPSSLAFIGMPKGIVMCPLAEAQATLAIRQMMGKVSLDFDHELAEANKRNEALKKQYPDSPTRVAQNWHRFIPYQSQTYDLIDLVWEKALDDRRVPDWQKELTAHGLAIRAEWRELERLGLTESWLEGIGTGGMQDWIDLMRRLVKRGQEKRATTESL